MAVAIGKHPGVIRNLVMMFGVDKCDDYNRTPLMFAAKENKVPHTMMDSDVYTSAPYPGLALILLTTTKHTLTPYTCRGLHALHS